MATVVVLLEEGDPDVVLGPSSAPELVRLGVTNVSLVRDRDVVGLIFEGWAFDPASATEAAEAIAPGRGATRILRPVVQVAVEPAGRGWLHRPDRASPDA